MILQPHFSRTVLVNSRKLCSFFLLKLRAYLKTLFARFVCLKISCYIAKSRHLLAKKEKKKNSYEPFVPLIDRDRNS